MTRTFRIPSGTPHRTLGALGTLGVALLLGCGDSLGPGDSTTFAFDFRQGEHDFTADFTDFPPEREEEVEFVAEARPLPDPLSGEGPALLSPRDIGVGTSVYLKTGASTEEPRRVTGDDGWVRLNVALFPAVPGDAPSGVSARERGPPGPRGRSPSPGPVS